MKLRCFFLLLPLLALQACHLDAHDKDNIGFSQKRLDKASAYNVQLGLEYLQQGDVSRAKRKLLSAQKQAPDSPAVNAAMAYFMEKTGEIQQARSYYLRAIAVAPGSGAQLNNYGAFLCRHGHYLQAESYFLKAVHDVQYEHTAGAYENAGLCAMALPDNEKAVRFFKQALQHDPTRKQSLYELVNVYIKQRKLHLALKTMKNYPQLVLHSPSTQALATKVAYQLGKLDDKNILATSGVKHHDNSNIE